MIDLRIVCDDEKYMPQYANDTDACMDVKVCTNRSKTLITPGKTVVVGTGIKVAIPEDYVMLLFPRSSTGFKLHCMFANGTGIIDAGYRDEIKMALHNFGDYTVEIEDGQRIGQFMIIPRPKVNLVQVLDNEAFRLGDRQGGVGSTGK